MRWQMLELEPKYCLMINLLLHALIYSCTQGAHCSVGWSDLALFCDFLLIRYEYIFMRSIKKLANFAKRAPVARAAKFSFSKNRRDLKYEYFLKICRIFPKTSKNNRQEENSKLKVV